MTRLQRFKYCFKYMTAWQVKSLRMLSSGVWLVFGSLLILLLSPIAGLSLYLSGLKLAENPGAIVNNDKRLEQ